MLRNKRRTSQTTWYCGDSEAMLFSQ